jgi:hypothetical protein
MPEPMTPETWGIPSHGIVQRLLEFNAALATAGV